MISNRDLENLAELSRIELSADEREKLREDLTRILDYIQELRSVPTEGVTPMAGGTLETNVERSDESSETTLPRESSVESFPESRGGFLKVPPVFE